MSFSFSSLTTMRIILRNMSPPNGKRVAATASRQGDDANLSRTFASSLGSVHSSSASKQTVTRWKSCTHLKNSLLIRLTRMLSFLKRLFFVRGSRHLLAKVGRKESPEEES